MLNSYNPGHRYILFENCVDPDQLAESMILTVSILLVNSLLMSQLLYAGQNLKGLPLDMFMSMNSCFVKDLCRSAEHTLYTTNEFLDYLFRSLKIFWWGTVCVYM